MDRKTYGCLSIARHHPALFARLTAAAAALALCATAQARDTNVTPHHLEHAAGSAVLAAGITAYTGSELEGFGATVAVGLAKELIDKTQGQYGMFTCKSLVADAIGAYVGAKVGGLYIAPAGHGFTLVLQRKF